MDLKFIDLFTGVGGFHLAFKNKAKCVFASEWDEKARTTYLANFGEDLSINSAIYAGDITKVDPKSIPSFDILCGGFPCQPFSIAGKQLGFSHATQGTLFFNLINIINHHKPKVVFLENVKNLQSHDGGNTFKVVLKSLEDEGYYVSYKVLNTKTHANIPQNRERIFIVGFLDKEAFDRFSYPKEVELTTQIEDCLQSAVDTKYYQTNTNSDAVRKMIKGVVKKGSIYQYRRYYVRENMNGVCPTLTANMGTGGHNVPLLIDNVGVRKLTPRECFNFQGYPCDFVLPNLSDASLYKQAGNSVTVPLISKIADEILKVVSKNGN